MQFLCFLLYIILVLLLGLPYMGLHAMGISCLKVADFIDKKTRRVFRLLEQGMQDD